ncbi:hypothetical protein [Dinghuibacter silviterrae]|nr:hypothetical protein [Dinghuibacter silviterrae]
MTTPKKIIFYHYSFAIPAEVSWAPAEHPTEIWLKQAAALDLPKEVTLIVKERRLVHFPDIFHQHMDTLRSIVEAIRNLGVSIFLKIAK